MCSPQMSLSGPTSLQFASCFCLLTPFPKGAAIMAHAVWTNKTPYVWPDPAVVVVVVLGRRQHVGGFHGLY